MQHIQQHNILIIIVDELRDEWTINLVFENVESNDSIVQINKILKWSQKLKFCYHISPSRQFQKFNWSI